MWSIIYYLYIDGHFTNYCEHIKNNIFSISNTGNQKNLLRSPAVYSTVPSHLLWRLSRQWFFPPQIFWLVMLEEHNWVLKNHSICSTVCDFFQGSYTNDSIPRPSRSDLEHQWREYRVNTWQVIEVHKKRNMAIYGSATCFQSLFSLAI